MELEERDGYMEEVLDKCPYLAKDVEELRRQHDEFRRHMRLLAKWDGLAQ